MINRNVYLTEFIIKSTHKYTQGKVIRFKYEIELFLLYVNFIIITLDFYIQEIKNLFIIFY